MECPAKLTENQKVAHRWTAASSIGSTGHRQAYMAVMASLSQYFNNPRVYHYTGGAYFLLYNLWYVFSFQWDRCAEHNPW